MKKKSGGSQDSRNITNTDHWYGWEEKLGKQGIQQVVKVQEVAEISHLVANCA